MNIQTENVLNILNHKTSDRSFVSLSFLEVEFGMTGIELRCILEDLKELGYAVEHQEGFQVSQIGKNFCYSKWV